MLRELVSVILGIAISVPLVSADTSSSSKNPCKVQTAKKDEGFVIGLAYWPGGTVEDWGNSSAGLNPCSADAGDLGGVEVAAFEMKVDTIGLLQTSRAIESNLFGREAVLSVVAFAGNKRSEARYIRSNDFLITGGNGTGILRNLVLIADFDEGKLEFLRWQDQGCFPCSENRCMQTGIVYEQEATFACAVASVEDCEGSNIVENFNCTTSFQVGMSGTDEDSVVLNTGVQLQRIQSLSLTNLYSDASTAVGDLTDRALGSG
eukprot:jgi/Ulvmu1/2000/UM012_0163.1